eukprot:scaffold63384_cov63-Phaeocystis_antarctica.AAC.3
MLCTRFHISGRTARAAWRARAHSAPARRLAQNPAVLDKRLWERPGRRGGMYTRQPATRTAASAARVREGRALSAFSFTRGNSRCNKK